jgi:DNA-3-methyladenine glycosylase II
MTARTGKSAASLSIDRVVQGPWSLRTSREFWEGFAPAMLDSQRPSGPESSEEEELRSVFLVEADWKRAEAVVRQDGDTATISVSGTGDLDAAAEQACRFLSLDIDARGWTEVAGRDAVIAEAQSRLPGLRPCGFHSPYEAAAWAVLSQRIQIRQAAALRKTIESRHGTDGAFPSPEVLRSLDLDLPGRKNEYLHAVADAALDGILDGARLRSVDAADALHEVQQIKGLGPFAAELVVIRGANAPDVMPTAERRLDAELAFRYGAGYSAAAISERWRPFRSWAAVHLRALHAIRMGDIA